MFIYFLILQSTEYYLIRSTILFYLRYLDKSKVDKTGEKMIPFKTMKMHLKGTYMDELD